MALLQAEETSTRFGLTAHEAYTGTRTAAPRRQINAREWGPGTVERTTP